MTEQSNIPGQPGDEDENASEEILRSWVPSMSEILESFNLDSIAGEGGASIPRVSGSAPTLVFDQPGQHTDGDDNPGSSLKLLKPLGKGGFGEVWEAHQKQLGRAVAVKLIRQDICPTRDPGDTRHLFADINLRQEAFTAATLDHPNIVPVYDLQQDERGFPAIAMKLVRGRPWDVVLRDEFSRMPVEEYLARHVAILISVTQAVAFAHSRGIIHRDLKPSQVMLGDYGEVLLMDWGLATVFDHPLLREATQTAPPAILPTLESASNPAGTLSYMAPEQTDSDAARIGPWTDTYLVGGMLYQILTGAPPRRGLNSRNTLAMARAGQVIPLADAAPGRAMPPELVNLCHWCLQPDLPARPQNGGEILQQLKDYQSGAGKRQHSREAADHAEQLLRDAGSDYNLLSRCEEQIGRAHELWPENPKAAELSAKLHSSFASAAIANGDLQLAELHASRASEAEKPTLLKRIENCHRVKKQRERERRLAAVLAVAALLFIAVGTMYYNHRVNTALGSSVAARSQAETLIAGLQENLFGELDSIGKVGLLAQLGGDIDNYFQRMESSDKTGQSQLRHIQSLLTLEQAQSRLGRRKDAKDTAARAVALAAQLVAKNPKSQDNLALLACAQAALAGQLYLGHASTDISMQQVTQTLGTLEKMQPDKIRNPDLAILAAKAAESLSRLKVALTGDTTGSMDVLNQAGQIRDRLLARSPSSPELLRGKAEHELAVAQTLIGCGKLDEAVDALTQARTTYQSDLASYSSQASHTAELAQIDFWLGRAYERQGEISKAIEAHTQALKGREQLVASNPDDITWHWNLASSQAKLAELKIGTGDTQSATPLLASALKVLDTETTASAHGRDFQISAATAKVAEGRLLELSGHKDEARQKWSEAVLQLREIESSAPYEYFTLRSLAEALLRLDRTTEAEQVTMKLRKLGYKATPFSKLLVEKGLQPL